MASQEETRVQTNTLRKDFKKIYGSSPRIFRAPGRVNLIGEHTDYNAGFVMPAAIDLASWVGVAPNDLNMLRISSRQFKDEVRFNLDALQGPPCGHWSDYVRGVAALLQSSGHALRGADLLIESNVPIGSGLSSSAALEVSSAFALAAVSEINLPKADVPQSCLAADQSRAAAQDLSDSDLANELVRPASILHALYGRSMVGESAVSADVFA